MKQLGMLAIMVAFAAFLVGKTAQSEKKQMSDIMLMNVEALATGESGEYIRCYSSGPVDCDGEKVAYRLINPFGVGDNSETE